MISQQMEVTCLQKGVSFSNSGGDTVWAPGAAWTMLACLQRGMKRVGWRKPHGQNKAWLGLGTSPGRGSSRSLGSAMFPPAVTTQTRLGVLPTAVASASELPALGQDPPTPQSPQHERKGEKGSHLWGGCSLPSYLPARRVDMGWGLVTYSLHILVLQTELPVLGANLVALSVHHLLQLLHHLPLALRHAWGGVGETSR